MTNYEDTYRQFTWDIPEFFNFGFDIIDRWGNESDKLALVSVDDSGRMEQRHTFSQLAHLSNQMANILTKYGIIKGDRVLIMLPNVPEWYTAVLGAIKLGAVFIPTPTLSSPRDIEYRIKQSEAMAVITNDEFADRFKGVKEHCPSLKTLFITSGNKGEWISLETPAF